MVKKEKNENRAGVWADSVCGKGCVVRSVRRDLRVIQSCIVILFRGER